MNISQYSIKIPSLQRRRVRIAIVSDAHFARKMSDKEIITRMLEVQMKVQQVYPDVIAVTGDLVSRNADNKAIEKGILMMKTLEEIAPTLYIFGNHETTMPQEMRDMLLQYLSECNVHLLNNSKVNLCGLDFYGYVLPNSCYQNEKGGYRGLEECTVTELKAALGERGEAPCVLLAHSPMGLPAYAEWKADVVLAGHVHGGIVRLPKLGGILSPERKFFPKYTKGVYTERQTTMFVSAGIGKLRIRNPAEIVCVELQKG